MGETSDAVSGSALRMWQIGAPNNSGWLEITQQTTLPDCQPLSLHTAFLNFLLIFTFIPEIQVPLTSFMGLLLFVCFSELEQLKSLFFKRLPCTPGNWAEGETIPLLLLNLNIWIHNLVMGVSNWGGKTCVLLLAPHFSKFLVNRPNYNVKTIFLLHSCLPFPFHSFLHGPYSTLTMCPYMVGREWTAPGQWIFIIPLWRKESEGSSSYFLGDYINCYIWYESWDLSFQSSSLIQEATTAAVLCAHLNAFNMY